MGFGLPNPKGKRKKIQEKNSGNCLTGAQEAIRIAGTAPANPEPVAAPVSERHAAAEITRTRAERPVDDIQMLAGFREIFELKYFTLLYGNTENGLLLKVAG